jgi:hypothetical protein
MSAERRPLTGAVRLVLRHHLVSEYEKRMRSTYMAPELYRIKYADRPDELLLALGKFVSYVKSSPVISLLPSGLRDISARDAKDVAAWEDRIDRILHDTLPLNASARFWLNEIDEVFKAARHRLDELVRNDVQPTLGTGATVH